MPESVCGACQPPAAVHSTASPLSPTAQQKELGMQDIADNETVLGIVCGACQPPVAVHSTATPRLDDAPTAQQTADEKQETPVRPTTLEKVVGAPQLVPFHTVAAP